MGSIRLSGINSGMDTDGMIKKIMDAENLKLKKVEDKKVTLEWKQDKWKDLNTKLYNLYTKHISPLRFEKAYEVKKGSSSNENAVKVIAEAGASIGDHSLKIKQTAQSHMLTGGEIKFDDKLTAETNLYELGVAIGATFKITVDGKTESFDVEGDSTIQNFVDFAKKAGINANFDEKHGRLYLSSKESGPSKSFQLVEEVADGDVMDGLVSLGLLTKEQILASLPEEEQPDGTIAKPTELPKKYKEASLATETEARKASYTLDGIEYESESNEVTTNGLKMTLLEATGSSSVRIGVTANVEDAYNGFKSFVKEYNELLKEMNKLYYADSARKYKPLSKEEKEAMSEKEIEQWEGKIKDSILRRDDKLGAILNSMKNALGASVTVGDKKYSLANFGVMTSGYQEKGLLHIFGDSEDGVYASRTDKFKKALSENPDEAGEALKKIMEGLYQKMTDGMKSTGLSSALTFYNDKEYKNLEETYKKQYTRLEEKLKKVEDKYYKQFAAMEKAMAKMNSQTNSLASMLGR